MARYVPPHRRNNAASSASHADTPVAVPPSHDFFHRHLYLGSPTLRQLEKLKDEFENDPNVERMFMSNRAYSAHTTAATTPTYSAPAPVSSHFANQFKGALEEVNIQTEGALRGRVKRFLDLGCAPGGFSRWILEQNGDATGLGVTLPLEMGGLPMIFDAPLKDEKRYKTIYRDVTDRPDTIRYMDPLSETAAECDLAIAGSIYRDHHTADPTRTGPPPLQTRSRQLLIFSQILASLSSLQSGGNLIVVSSMKPLLHNLEILCFFRDFFDQLKPVKPKGVHTIRSSYYLAALGFNREKAQEKNAFGRLADALNTIRQSDEETGVQRLLLLDGTEEEIVNTYGTYAMEFYHPLWESQIHAIQRKLAGLRTQRGLKNGYRDRTCWAFAEGRCTNGAAYRFSHDRSDQNRWS